jgi:hypothetical protein
LSNNAARRPRTRPRRSAAARREMRIPAAAVHHLDARHRRALGLATEWACWVERGVSRFRPVRPRAATAGLIIHQRRAGGSRCVAPPDRSGRSSHEAGTAGRARADYHRRRAKLAKRPSWRCRCRSDQRRQRMRCLTSAVGAGAGTRRTGRRFDGRVLVCAARPDRDVEQSAATTSPTPDRRVGAGVGPSLELSTQDHSRPAQVMTLRRPSPPLPRTPHGRRPTARYRPAGIDVAVWSGDRADRMRPSGSPARGLRI